MKKLLPLLLLLVSLNISGQQNKRERIKALKVSFITEKLDLTTQEAQKFWPVYNAHEKEMFAIRFKEMRDIRKEIKNNIDTMTDEKANTLLTRLNTAEIKAHKIKVELVKNLSSILSPKKIILLKVAEEDFKRKILDEFKKRRKEKN
ncbi:sensor of ECF-type sigma factor [uncultured Algibacter sp.]|uniref:sensor of ECF-type sigma factor n=1 Tax=uncultured Algibacter sp. TaxID=298659 RepID=UPI00261CE1F1|nr:sensor of ECF-type sigma factor [uncultured Algibacter sp.]